jgi:hypothetical protein
MHLFGHSVDHDCYFELLREEERDAQSHVRKKAEVLSGTLRTPLGARPRIVVGTNDYINYRLQRFPRGKRLVTVASPRV